MGIATLMLPNTRSFMPHYFISSLRDKARAFAPCGMPTCSSSAWCSRPLDTNNIICRAFYFPHLDWAISTLSNDTQAMGAATRNRNIDSIFSLHSWIILMLIYTLAYVKWQICWRSRLFHSVTFTFRLRHYITVTSMTLLNIAARDVPPPHFGAIWASAQQHSFSQVLLFIYYGYISLF